MPPFADLQGYDIAVIGAGPAGAAAAVAAADLRLRVAIVDEQAVAGGHAYRVVPGITPQRPDAERTDGDQLRAQLGAANVVRYFGHRVARVEHRHERWRVQATGPGGPSTIEARALIVATGAQERHLPFAGWETPGVMGLAAATLLLKAQRVLPGRNVVVAGAGPLLLLVAKGIIDGGGRVAGIVDAHPRSAWFASATELLARPDLATRGMNWYRAVVGHGVAIHHGSVIAEVTGASPDLRVRAVAVDRDGHWQASAPPLTLACDAVCCGFGLVSSTDFTHMLGASHGFDPGLGGWHVVVDDEQRTSVPRLYAAGDGAGIVGAAAAPWQGRIAAIAAASDLGKLSATEHAARMAPSKREALRAARFGGVMTRLANVGDGVVASLAADVTMCSCRRLTRATLDEAIAAGNATFDELKKATGCGTGPCGGRICEEAIARLIGVATGHTRVAVGQASERPSLSPLGT